MPCSLIRQATILDARGISVLIESFSHTYLVNPTRAEKQAFLDTISATAIEALVVRSDIDYVVAEDSASGVLTGAAAMRTDGALTHLFVKPTHQRQGLGRRLWEHLRDRALLGGHAGPFKVYSSIDAVPVYERFGFKVVGDRVEKNGGASVPMTYERPSQRSGTRFEIREEDFSGEAARALLELHMAGMHRHSPPGEVFALDLAALREANITSWSAWDGQALAGIAALRVHEDRTGELKSMRTHPVHLRRGVADALLRHVIGEARRRGLRRLHLETGRGDAFEPALSLYRKHGFSDGDVFADYRPSAFSRFLRLDLEGIAS